MAKRKAIQKPKAALAARLKEARQARFPDVPAVTVAMKYLNLNKQKLHAYETGRATPPALTLLQIMHTYGLSVDDLV